MTDEASPNRNRQNTSHAVMARRHEAADSPDDFPTPPWATRALMEHVLPGDWRDRMALEPACGRGRMATVLVREYFGAVLPTDLYDYGGNVRADFLTHEYPRAYDWVITNPPFRLAEAFILRALPLARVGVAMLVRTSFVEGIGRYERLFRDRPPSMVAQFVERVPMVRGRLDPLASTATAYAWLVWRHGVPGTRLMWIPPSRKALERPGDYDGV